ncbi:putative toxin-antitoxin system toxin component, PIN family [Rhizobium sp. C4]|uniref:putative toxin-antitoxin system toxin component, PIN family n=1 Tax=Rhizobium sp. C4 TaxID=1349800 RepID=UPI001E4C3764|nr:putative toxin-antitoxin system toxin component, PIN family [Rhizobium sp. C4]MCD2175217.1 putative toxin-antitoxin system toxin component, PIN family [Rhizobium sp. C4]
MRIVVDTNVFIGACIGRGPASQVIESCLLEKFTPQLSPTLLLEYTDVLGREAIFKNARLDFEQRRKLLLAFSVACEWRQVYFRWRPNLRDEADNHLVELAISSNASIIVTENLRDFAFQDLRFPQIRVLNSRDFLEFVKR